METECSQQLHISNGRWKIQLLKQLSRSMSIMFEIDRVESDAPTIGGNYLKIAKPDTPLNFQEGLSYAFTFTKVNQVSFYFDSTSVQTEDTNLRLLDNSV
jgi:hypothetical protein